MRIMYFTANSQFAESAKDAEQTIKLTEYDTLNLWSELERVTDVLFDARAEGRVELEVVPETSRSDVFRYLSEHSVEVVHFSGHGDQVQGSPEADPEHHLILMDEDHKGLFGELTPNQWLREQLAGREIDLLVLNCCWSAGVAKALQGVARCIIGTRFELRSDNAADFSALLYRELEQGSTLRQIKALCDSQAKFKDQYEFVLADDAALDLRLAPIPAAERSATPPRIVIARQEEVGAMLSSHRLTLQADLLKVGFALVVSFVGWFVFAGAGGLLERWSCDPTRSCAPETAWDFLRLLVSKATWLRWEPAAIMTAVCANPAGRLAAYGITELGLQATRASLRSLSIRPPAVVERYLATGRIDAMISWLKEQQK